MQTIGTFKVKTSKNVEKRYFCIIFYKIIMNFTKRMDWYEYNCNVAF